MKKNIVKKTVSFLIFIGVFAGISAIVMLLWNLLIPSVFGWNQINFWQSVGLILLSKFLFGGMGKLNEVGFMFNYFNPVHRATRKHMKNFHDKMNDMSTEERKEYIRKHIVGADDDKQNSPDNKE